MKKESRTPEKEQKSSNAQETNSGAQAAQASAEAAAESQKNSVGQQTSPEPTIEEKYAALCKQNEQLSQQVGKLEKTVSRLQNSADKSDTYLTQLVALKSDFDSYKRRMKLNTEQAKTEGVQSVAVKLIDIADTFEIARKQISDEETLKAFEMIFRQLTSTLQSCGVEMMNVLGEDFDHNTMEALSTMDRGEENRGKVVEVYKNGYTMQSGDVKKVVRYAQVVVGA